MMVDGIDRNTRNSSAIDVRPYSYPSISTWYDEALKQHKIGMITAPQQVVTKQVIEALNLDTEGKMKQALIDLGWMPPPTVQKEAKGDE